MNKAELIEKVAAETSASKASVNQTLDAILNQIQKALKKGEPVQLIGFGTWNRRKRKARTGRNPQTGASIKISARNTIGFSAGKKWKQMVN